jgi:hypothetical protein
MTARGIMITRAGASSFSANASSSSADAAEARHSLIPV